ncbi:hypothetical protein CC78DRAFT_529451 [Lojkania enalia]|uniref:AAA+ ATPase domain-containing protein n=1 Tax=Lojkania enalia TaxID=147567 RepID=A0A9P4N9S2_9PLEO|nr:hypothetical protein CC78DRAFT_529451 [Didymosphaeria enalia]
MRGLWTSLLAQKEKRDSLALTRVLTSHEAAMNLQSPKGLMLHGEVGTGKSMLVDLFADCLPNRKKRRYHFNMFMLDTFSRLEALRKSQTVRRQVPGGMRDEYSLLWLARNLIETSPILFLDEFQLPDRATSKILSNLMTSFFQLGGVLIATSNRMPEELAKAAGMEFARPVSRITRLGWSLGLGIVVGKDDGPGQRGEFAQFLEVLRARCEVWEMEGKKDYRRYPGGNKKKDEELLPAVAEEVPQVQTATGGHADSSATTSSDTDSTFPPEPGTTVPKFYLLQSSLSASDLDTIISTTIYSPNPIPWSPSTLTVYGRKILIPRQHNGIAHFTFQELCGATFGPADYITLASTYHTLILTSIPILTFPQKNEARRLITLLDALYEARCRLLISASATPDNLFFPEPPIHTSASPPASSSSGKAEGGLVTDAVHPETYSEIHQDLTSPFRPNISSYAPSLSDDALEDDPPSRFRRPGSSFTDERRGESVKAPDFANISGLTGEDERFAVRRARSRVWEMCSARWWDGRGDVGNWWRPLPKEDRYWERSGQLQSLVSSSTTRHGEDAAVSEIRKVGEMEDLFQHGASPFRTTSDPPPKINWTHVWGTMLWGKKAGAWGKGVEGLEERKREKKGVKDEQDSEDRNRRG